LSFDPRIGLDIEDLRDPFPGFIFWIKKIPVISKICYKIEKNRRAFVVANKGTEKICS
jgi:hypothetical protein